MNLLSTENLREPHIDGLRGLAILAVLAFHTWPHWVFGYEFIQSGFIGVDIFFTISGFLITKIILTQKDNNNFQLIKFYCRRINRLLPSLLTVTTISLLFGWYILLPDEFQQLSKHIASGLTFSSNFMLINESGYFDKSADTKALLHLWSLAIEWQFYALWPLLLYKIHKKFLLKIAIFFFATSFFVNILNIHADSVWNFYHPITRFWELLIGAITALLIVEKKIECLISKNISNFFSLIGLTLIIGVTTSKIDISTFPGWIALAPSFGTSLLLISGKKSIINTTLFTNKIITSIGLISYPLYLWHWPLLVFYKLSTNSYSINTRERFLIVVVSFTLAALTYFFIEKNLLNKPKIRLVLISWGILLIISLLCLFTTIPPRNNNDEISLILKSKSDWQYPDPLFKREIQNGLRYYTLKNNHEFTLYIGDSNIEQYSGRVSKIITEYKSSNGAIFVGNQKNCFILAAILTYPNHYNYCSESQIKQLKILIDDERVSTIVLAAQWDFYHNFFINAPDIVKSLQNIFKNKKIFIILTIPGDKVADPDNMFTGNRFVEIKPKTSFEESYKVTEFKINHHFVHEKLRVIAQKLDATIVDPIDTLCSSEKCPIFDKKTGAPLYRDSSHLTWSYATEKASYIDQTLFKENGQKFLENKLP